MNYRVKTKTKHKYRRYAALAIVVLVVIGGAAYIKLRPDDSASPQITKPGSAGKGVNLNPPTSQDKTFNDQHKDDLVAQQKGASPSKTADGKIKVQPVIVYADKATVNAYVTGIFEDGGTCSAVVTQGSKTITRSSTGFGNSSYTQCPPISLSDANLGSGTWSVIVNYTSPKAEGSSSPATFKS